MSNKSFFTGLALLLILTLAGCPGGGSVKKTDFAGEWSDGSGDISITNVTEQSFQFYFLGITADAHIGELEGEALFTTDNKAVFDFHNEVTDEPVKIEFTITDGKLIVAITEGNMLGYFGEGVYMDGKYGKRQSPEPGIAQQEDALAVATEVPLERLLRNNEQLFRFKNIVKHNGQVYADNLLSIPGFTLAPYYGMFTIIGSEFFYISGESFENARAELSRIDAKGDNRTVIAENAGNAWAFGDRIIYTTIVDDWDTSGACWYDVKSSKITRLIDEEFYTFVAFDDEFAYYRDDNGISRVRWDGTQKEVLQGVAMPDNLNQIEGEYYYCFDSEWDNPVAEISRHSIKDGKPEGKYTIDNGLMGIEDGWAFYGSEKGIFKMDMKDGKTVKLADMVSFEDGYEFSSVGALLVIIEGVIYFEIFVFYSDDPCATVRLFKLPVNGGKMEYTDLEWGQGC